MTDSKVIDKPRQHSAPAYVTRTQATRKEGAEADKKCDYFGLSLN